MITIIKRIDLNTAELKGSRCNGVVIAHKNNNNSILRITETIINDNKLSFILDRKLNQQNGLGILSSLAYSNIYLNNNIIGHEATTKTHDGMTVQSIHLNNALPILIYDIGIGDKFLFFYSGSIPIGCAHQDGPTQYSIFSEDEWYTQLIATHIGTFLLYGDNEYANSYLTNDRRILEKYDGNYISELIQSEPIEIREKYKHLIRKKFDKEEVLEKAVKTTRSGTLKAMFFVFAFFALIFAIIFGMGYSNYKSTMAMKPYYATNNDLDGSHHAVSGVPGFFKYGLDIVYEKDGKTVQEVIYVSKSTYEKYKNEEHFYFRVVKEVVDGDAEYTYYIEDPSLMDFIDIWVIIVLIPFFALFEGLLLYALLSSRKKKKT